MARVVSSSRTYAVMTFVERCSERLLLVGRERIASTAPPGAMHGFGDVGAAANRALAGKEFLTEWSHVRVENPTDHTISLRPRSTDASSLCGRLSTSTNLRRSNFTYAF